MTRHSLIAIVFMLILSIGAGADIHLGDEGRQTDSAVQKEEVTGMLTARFSTGFLLDNMLPSDSWKPFPPASDRTAWEALGRYPINTERKTFLVERAEAMLGRPWPALPATLYMEYARTGNRSHYQDPYFERRTNLSVLVLAECIEHRGRFLDEIANGLWAISEEATWCVPAHATRYRDDVLHRQDIEGVDLFACETAMTLAMTRYILRDELEDLSRALCDRVRREVLRRVVEPVEAGDEFGRSRWLDGHNNWSPWCASNILGAGMLLIEDQQRLAALTHRLMAVIDRFINGYGDDGGCDEGPGYWNEAGGAMLIFFELLDSRTDGAIAEVYTDPKIAAMGRYIARARLTGPWFANFADAGPRSNPDPAKAYRYGERIGSEPMKNMAMLGMRNWRVDGRIDPPIRISRVSRPLLGALMELFWIPPEAKPTLLPREPEVWLPDLEVLFAHESAISDEKGLALAAKGGHNAENHNHNDVGHFILFLDGQPGIIDIGAETYTAKTFSKERYDIWCLRASGHNMPVVNGVEQAAGRTHRATQVAFRKTDDAVHLAMNIEQAYPKEAGLESLRREFEFVRRKPAMLRVRDTFELDDGPADIRTVMYAALPVEHLGPGRLAIGCRPRRLVLDYSPADMHAAVETVPLEDKKLRSSWGEQLYRISVEYRIEERAGSCEFRFHAEK